MCGWPLLDQDMRQAIFAGSFDPLTTGHLWMICEGARLFDVLHVLVAVNPAKRALFSPQERGSIIARTIARMGLANVRIDSTSSEFIAHVANRKGVDYLLRGLRSTADFDQEDLLRQTNKELFSGPQTVFLIPPKGLSSVSSSFVKALVGPVGWAYAVAEFLPEEAYRSLLEANLAERWVRMVGGMAARLGRERVDEGLASEWFRERILPSHTAPGRHYHGLSHLAHCLSEADALAQNEPALDAGSRTQLECAIFFHDLVYRKGPLPVEPGEGDEEASARYAATFLREVFQAPAEWRAQVEATILATRYAVPLGTDPAPLATWMRDIDLSILGRPGKEYARYASAVREEYADVPEAAFTEGRAKVLAGFLDPATQGDLFTSDWFRTRQYNPQASENLASEIQALRSRT